MHAFSICAYEYRVGLCSVSMWTPGICMTMLFPVIGPLLTPPVDSRPMAASEVFADGALAGRAVLVTGGGTGLGKAAAAELRRCGAEVVICGRREEVLAATAAELDLHHVAGDVREAADSERILRFALERCGRLDALVNNAGGQYFTPAEAIEPKGWRAVTRLNVGATERMTRLAAELAFLPAGGGTVVNVTLSPHHGLAA